jgi:hypothetical protein
LLSLTCILTRVGPPSPSDCVPRVSVGSCAAPWVRVRGVTPIALPLARWKVGGKEASQEEPGEKNAQFQMIEERDVLPGIPDPAILSPPSRWNCGAHLSWLDLGRKTTTNWGNPLRTGRVNLTAAEVSALHLRTFLPDERRSPQSCFSMRLGTRSSAGVTKTCVAWPTRTDHPLSRFILDAISSDSPC